MQKQAVLILAHNNLWTLERIIKILDSKYFDIFIHIDKKSSIDCRKLNDFCKESNIYIFKDIDVRWADFSIVRAELLLLKKAISIQKYDYYHLISGNDLPIKKAKDIYDFFNKNKGHEFVHFESYHISSKKLNRLKYYYKLTKYSRTSKVLRILEKLSIFLQRFVFINRLKSNSFTFMSGAQWFSITDDFARYLMSQEKVIDTVFRDTFAPDEEFVQTILFNSPYIDKLYDKKYDDNYESCMRLIDWERGNPYSFTNDDYEMIRKSKCLFARKFDEKKDKLIIEKIYKDLIK